MLAKCSSLVLTVYSPGAWDVPFGFQKQGGGCCAAQAMCLALGTGLGESTRKLHSSASAPGGPGDMAIDGSVLAQMCQHGLSIFWTYQT